MGCTCKESRFCEPCPEHFNALPVMRKLFDERWDRLVLTGDNDLSDAAKQSVWNWMVWAVEQRKGKGRV